MYWRQDTGAASTVKNADDPAARPSATSAAPGDCNAHVPGEENAPVETLDTLVVLDSYFLRVYRIREEVCFVTTDNAHILSNRDRIEELLPGIAVREPGAFLAGERG